MKQLKPMLYMQGATLIIALIMLVLIAIIGFGAMQTTTMEEKMAGNLRDNTISFQAAEAGLRDREDWLSSLTTKPSANSWLFSDEINWDAPLTYGADSGRSIDGVQQQPELVVQEFEFIPDDLITGFEPSKGRDLYRIMSRGTGQSPNANTTLESTSAKRFN